MTKWFPIALRLVIIIVALSLTEAACATMTVEGVKQLIAKDLPIGSSKESVMAFVREHQLASDNNGEGWYSVKDNAIYAMVRNVRRSLLARTDIQTIFHLGTDGRLKSYTVREVHTGP